MTDPPQLTLCVCVRLGFAVYRHLWSNGPKECLEFADYFFEDHFGHAIPSFPPREVLHHYIAGRVEKVGVGDWVSLATSTDHRLLV